MDNRRKSEPPSTPDAELLIDQPPQSQAEILDREDPNEPADDSALPPLGGPQAFTPAPESGPDGETRRSKGSIRGVMTARAFAVDPAVEVFFSAWKLAIPDPLKADLQLMSDDEQFSAFIADALQRDVAEDDARPADQKHYAFDALFGTSFGKFMRPYWDREMAVGLEQTVDDVTETVGALIQQELHDIVPPERMTALLARFRKGA